MNPFTKMKLVTGIALISLGTSQFSVAQSDTEIAEQMEEANQSVESVSDQFSGFLGDNSDSLVTSLRNGEDLTYEMENDNGEMETVTVENTTGEASLGEISLALGLAEEELGNDADYGDIVNFLHGEEGVFTMRANGEGWGQIYAQHDLRVGEVISRVKANENAMQGLDRAQDAGRPENINSGRPDNIGRPEGAGERPDLPDRANNAARSRPDIPNRPARPNRP